MTLRLLLRNLKAQRSFRLRFELPNPNPLRRLNHIIMPWRVYKMRHYTDASSVEWCNGCGTQFHDPSSECIKQILPPFQCRCSCWKSKLYLNWANPAAQEKGKTKGSGFFDVDQRIIISSRSCRIDFLSVIICRRNPKSVNTSLSESSVCPTLLIFRLYNTCVNAPFVYHHSTTIVTDPHHLTKCYLYRL